MTTLFEDREFSSYYDDGGNEFTDLEFRRCRFVSSAISITRNPCLRSTIRNVKLANCNVHGCTLDTAIVEEVIVDNLSTHGLFHSWGAAFKHVILRGKIGRIMFSPAVATGTADPEEQRAFDQANATYYANVDWALDIRDAEFQGCDIRGIPAQLIRRDPSSQVVVTREKAIDGRWRKLDLSQTAWATAIEFLLDRKDADVVLVAPKSHPNFRQLLDGLNLLRDNGVAEPD